MRARQREIDQATAWLERMRARLAWLIEDGFTETDARVIPAQFQVAFRGPHAAISISVVPGMSEIDIFLKPRGAPGHGPALQDYLGARELRAPLAIRADRRVLGRRCGGRHRYARGRASSAETPRVGWQLDPFELKRRNSARRNR